VENKITEQGLRYREGLLRQRPIEGRFAPSRREDVDHLESAPPDALDRWARDAADALARGEVAFGVLAAGASSRMDLRALPRDVARMLSAAGRTELPTSKALVPVAERAGDVLDFLDLFLIDVRRVIEATGARGPVVLFVSETNRSEIAARLEATGRRGIERDRVWMFEQPLEPTMIATEADARRAAVHFPPERLDDVLAVSRARAGEPLPGRKPAGHGEFLHQLIASGTLSRLIERGVRYLSLRNIDNFAARLDRRWLAALGMSRELAGRMLVEVSQRPTGQKGGALVRRGDRWMLAEDPSFAGTPHRASDSYYINNAVAVVRLDYFEPIYETTADELVAASRDAHRGSERLAEIARRGRLKFPTLIEAKPFALDDGSLVAAVLPETNLWESTGIDGAEGLVPLAVDSDQDAGPDLLEQPEPEQERRAERVRFSPTKNWSDYEDARKRRIARTLVDRILAGEALPP